MSCANCKSPINPGSKFCGNCGTPVASTAPPAYSQMPPPAQGYPQPGQPYPQAGQPYNAPQAGQPYNAPQAGQPYNAPQAGQPYPVGQMPPPQAYPPPGGAAGTLVINATNFNRGRAFKNDVGYGDVITTNGIGHCVVEYDSPLQSPGQYKLKIRFAALERRPINVFVNNVLTAPNALNMTTGGWHQPNQIWTDVATINVPNNFVTIKLDQIGACLPHISQIMLEKVGAPPPMVVIAPVTPVVVAPVILNPRAARKLRKQAKHMKVPCQMCQGKGGIGAFGPCYPRDVHYRTKCPCCKGKCVTKRSTLCSRCGGKGGFGAFGPCTPWDVHFRSRCDPCKGTGYRKSRHGSSSSSSDSD